MTFGWKRYLHRATETEEIWPNDHEDPLEAEMRIA